VRGRLRSGLVIGILCAGLGVVAYLTPWGWEKEQAFGLTWLFQSRGGLTPPPDVVIVAITRSAADRLALPYKTERWPRTLHAELVDGLHRAGARTIVFDLLFREPRGEADIDFAASLARAGNVLLLEFLEKRTAGPASAKDPARGAVVHSRVQPIAGLTAASAATAPFTLAKVPRQIAQFWLFDANAGDAASVPLLALIVHLLSWYPDLAERIDRAVGRDGLCGAGGTGLGAAGPVSASGVLADTLGRYPRLASVAPVAQRPVDPARYPPVAPPVVDNLVAALCPPPSRYLNFYGPPWTVQTIEYDEALRSLRGDPAARLPADFWAGKAVFVGLSSPVQWEQSDEFPTPFSDRASGHDLSGIEILATAFANLLHRETLSPLPPLGALGLLVAVGLSAGLVLRLLTPLWAALAAGLLASAYALAGIELFSQRQLWLPVVVPVLLQVPLALFLAGAWHYVEARRDKARLRRIFGYYLPDPVVDRLVQQGLQPGHDRERVFGVCLATDAQQYTALSESLSPDALADYMNAYYALLFEPVRRHGGIVSDVVGDAMMAIWAARDPDVDIRAAACRAALEIADAVSRTHLTDGRSALRTRIGLHCGSITLAHVGAGDHFEYRAVGDIVNVASRLEGLNKAQATGILVSADMVDGLEEARVRPLGRFRLPGKQSPVEVCELLGWQEQGADRGG
jgi:adenylate cyclase